MRIAYFTHSLASCWNHGNAHFLRGVLRELIARGHSVAAYEPSDGWSRSNLIADNGAGALDLFAAAYPELTTETYDRDVDLERAVQGANLVLVHEWNEPWLVANLGLLRRRGGSFLLLFHDTHHRAVSDPDSIARMPLEDYDGILAFGATLAEVYRRAGWGGRAFVWHEAADTRLFQPPAPEGERRGLVWIGNWGDDERSAELEQFLFRPAQTAEMPLDVHGVRYPADARALLQRYGARYQGWLANPRVPAVFARHQATVHVPRRFYVDTLPGIPTIRVFEALACGIPLLSAPWQDSEGLFRPGSDFLQAADETEMTQHMRALRHDRALADGLAARGLATIRARHTCAHRVDELLDIAGKLGSQRAVEAAA